MVDDLIDGIEIVAVNISNLTPFTMAKIWLLYSITLFILLFSACQPKQAEIVISGTLAHNFEKQIYLSQITPNGLILLDSTEIKEGKFTFELTAENKEESITLQTPHFYQISLSKENGLTTLARAGDHLNITANAESLIKSYTISGSKDAELMYLLDKNLNTFVDTVDKLMAIYNENVYNDTIKVKIEERYLAAVEKHTTFLKQFIRQNGESLASITAFYQRYNRRIFLNSTENKNLADSLCQTLTLAYPTSEDVEFFRQQIFLIKQ